MKIPIKKFILFLLVVLLISLNTCDIVDNNDPCDRTAFNISQTLKLKVNTKWIKEANNLNADGENVRIEFHKIACGFDEYKPGGDITFTGVTDPDGYYISGFASYNIRNSGDKVIIIISRKINEVWKQVNHEEYSFIEEDFNGNAWADHLTMSYTFRL